MLFIMISIVLFYTIIYIMPKRITLLEMYATTWFTLTLVMTVDIYLSFKLNLYGYFEGGTIVWKTLIIHFGVFPAYNIIFLNFFPQIRRHQVLYVLGHSLICVVYEEITILTGAFYHHHWSLVYSVMLYPFILLILYLNLKMIRILKGKET